MHWNADRCIVEASDLWRSEQKPELPVVRLGYTFVTHKAVTRVMEVDPIDPVDPQSFHVGVPT